MKLLFAFLLFFHSSSLWATTFAGQVTVVNDTSYILTAAIYTAPGDFLGQVTLQPGEQNNFTTNLNGTSINRPGYPNISLTPYRVVWQCAGGDVYGVCDIVSVGSYLRASSCDGQHACNPKKEPPKAFRALLIWSDKQIQA